MIREVVLPLYTRSKRHRPFSSSPARFLSDHNSPLQCREFKDKYTDRAEKHLRMSEDLTVRVGANSLGTVTNLEEMAAFLPSFV